MDGINQGLNAKRAYALHSGQTGSASAMQAGVPSAPPPQPNINDLIGTAGEAMNRLYGVADSVECLGDKLVGAAPQPIGEGSIGGKGSGSLGEIASCLSMIHAAISRIEKGMTRLHDIHG